MKKYSFDVVKMIRWLLPFFLLKPIHLAWLKTLHVSLKNRYADFLSYRALTLANATINSSVNRLTQALWDNFDPTQATYLLQNPSFHQAAFIYLHDEYPTPAFDYLSIEKLNTEFDYLTSEESLLGYNFVVRIPLAIAAKTNAIYAFVKRYIFSSITFTVQTF